MILNLHESTAKKQHIRPTQVQEPPHDLPMIRAQGVQAAGHRQGFHQRPSCVRRFGVTPHRFRLRYSSCSCRRNEPSHSQEPCSSTSSLQRDSAIGIEHSYPENRLRDTLLLVNLFRLGSRSLGQAHSVSRHGLIGSEELRPNRFIPLPKEVQEAR